MVAPPEVRRMSRVKCLLSPRVLLAVGLVAAAAVAQVLGSAALDRLRQLPEGVWVPDDLVATALWPFAAGELLARSVPLPAPLVRPLPALAALLGLVLGLRLLPWALGLQWALALEERWQPLTREGLIGVYAQVLTGRRCAMLVLQGVARGVGAVVVWSFCWYLVGAGMSAATDSLREVPAVGAAVMRPLDGALLLLASAGAWACGLSFPFVAPILLATGALILPRLARAREAALRRWWTRQLAEGGEPPGMTRLAALEWKLRRRLLGRKAYLFSSIGTPEVMDLLDVLADSALSAGKRTGASGVSAARMHAAGAAEEG